MPTLISRKLKPQMRERKAKRRRQSRARRVVGAVMSGGLAGVRVRVPVSVRLEVAALMSTTMALGIS